MKFKLKAQFMQRLKCVIGLLLGLLPAFVQAQEQQPYRLFELKHMGPVSAVAFSQDGRFLATGAWAQGAKDVELWVWDFVTKKAIALEARNFDGMSVELLRFTFQGDLFCGYDRGRYAFWDVRKRQLSENRPWAGSNRTTSSENAFPDVTDWQWSQHGDLNVVHLPQEILILAKTPDTLQAEVVMNPIRGKPGNFALSDDGTLLAIESGKLGITLHDTAKAGMTKAFQPDPTARNSIYDQIVWIPRSKNIAVRSLDTVWLIDTATGNTLWVRNGARVDLNAMAASQDGKWIATVGQDSTVIVRDIQTGRIRRSTKIKETTSRGTPNWILSVAFSPDGKQVAFGANDCGVYLWDHEKSQVGPYSDETPAEPANGVAQPKSKPRQPTPIDP